MDSAALGPLAAELAYAYRHAKRRLRPGLHDRFIRPICNILSDIHLFNLEAGASAPAPSTPLPTTVCPAPQSPYKTPMQTPAADTDAGCLDDFGLKRSGVAPSAMGPEPETTVNDGIPSGNVPVGCIDTSTSSSSNAFGAGSVYASSSSTNAVLPGTNAVLLCGSATPSSSATVPLSEVRRLMQEAAHSAHAALADAQQPFIELVDQLASRHQAQLAELQAQYSALAAARPAPVPVVAVACQAPAPSAAPPRSRARWRRAVATRRRMYWSLDFDAYRQSKAEIDDHASLRPWARSFYAADADNAEVFTDGCFSNESPTPHDDRCPLCMDQLEIDGTCACGFNPYDLNLNCGL